MAPFHSPHNLTHFLLVLAGIEASWDQYIHILPNTLKAVLSIKSCTQRLMMKFTHVNICTYSLWMLKRITFVNTYTPLFLYFIFRKIFR